MFVFDICLRSVVSIRFMEPLFSNFAHQIHYGHPSGADPGGEFTVPKALAAAKHAFDYDLENWGGFSRSNRVCKL